MTITLTTVTRYPVPDNWSDGMDYFIDVRLGGAWMRAVGIPILKEQAGLVIAVVQSLYGPDYEYRLTSACPDDRLTPAPQTGDSIRLEYVEPVIA